MYSGIYFATDLLNEKYGKAEANKAVIIGAVANVIVMFTLVLSTYYLPSGIASSANEVHQAISTLALYSPIFVIGSITAYLISQTFDVWVFHKIKTITGDKYLWLRNNVSTLSSQAWELKVETLFLNQRYLSPVMVLILWKTHTSKVWLIKYAVIDPITKIGE